MHVSPSSASSTPSDSILIEPGKTFRSEASVACFQAPLDASNGTSRLPVSGFIERMELIMAISLPCMMKLGGLMPHVNSTRIKGWQYAPAKGIKLFGERFSVSFQETEVDSALIFTRRQGAQFASITIQDKANTPLLTLFSASTSTDMDIWEDIMGNPCQTN